MKVLIIEDETKIANAIKKGLEQEAFVTEVSYNGEEGCELAVNEKYDVIILDRMLPKMDGMDVCVNLRKNDIQTPILMLTAKSTLDDKVDGLDCGADDYLTKPFSFKELLARLRALGRRQKDMSTNNIKISDLELNTSTHKVKKSGKEVSLSKKEYTLLEYLMINKGRVVSKNDILENVWSYESDILPNTIEVYIGYLRKKLNKNNTKKINLIKTVRGFGYKIDDN